MVPPNTTQRELGEIRSILEGLKEDLAKQNKMMMGNGQPGIYQKTLSLEHDVEQAACRQEEILDGIQKLTESIGALKDIVEVHHADKAQHTPAMLLRKDFIVIVMLVFIVLHSLVPAKLSLWDVLTKFFGL